jgi:O-antigen ligase
MFNVNFKKFFNFNNNISFCNLFLSISPALLIIGVVFLEFVNIYSSLIVIYSLLKKKIKIQFNFIILLFGLFYIVINLSSFMSGDSNSIFKSIAYIRFFLLYLFIINFFNYYYFKLLLKIILISLLFLYIDIFFQYITGKDFFGYPPDLNLNRYQGPFGEELISGAYIKKYLFLSLILLILIKKIYLLNIYLLLSITIAFITGERMAFILIAFGILLFIFSDLKKNTIIFLSFFSFFTIIFLFLINPNLENEKLKNIQNRYNNSFKIALGIDVSNKSNYKFTTNSVHFAHWATALELFKQKPFFGHGIKQYRNKCSTIKSTTLNNNYNIDLLRAETYKCTTHPHNFYLELISETGALSLMIILLLCVLYFKKILNLDNPNYRIPFFLCLLVHIFPIATTGSFFTNHNSFHFWFVISLIEFIYVNQLKKLDK